MANEEPSKNLTLSLQTQNSVIFFPISIQLSRTSEILQSGYWQHSVEKDKGQFLSNPRFPIPSHLGNFKCFFFWDTPDSPMDTKSKAVTTETSGVLRAVTYLGPLADVPPYLDTEYLSGDGTFLNKQARNKTRRVLSNNNGFHSSILENLKIYIRKASLSHIFMNSITQGTFMSIGYAGHMQR